MLLERGERGRVPAHIKCGAHRIIPAGTSPSGTHAAPAAGSLQRRCGPVFFNYRMKRISVGCSRGSGKLGLTRTLMKKVISRSVKIAPQISNTLLVRRHRRRGSRRYGLARLHAFIPGYPARAGNSLRCGFYLFTLSSEGELAQK